MFVFRAEIKKLRSIIYIRNFIFCLGDISWRLSFYLLVLTYVYLGYDITAEKIFVVITCYTTLRFYLSFGIPLGVSNLAEASASANRIVKLLKQPSLDYVNVSGEKEKTPTVKLTNVVAALSPSKTIFDKINLDIDRGIVALTGPLGSGKSSLLKVILHDLLIVKGDIQVSYNFINNLHPITFIIC